MSRAVERRLFAYSEQMQGAAAYRGTARPGEAVRRERRRRGLTLRGLARLLEVSPATVSALENGHTGISLTRLDQIAAVLGVPLAALLDDPDATALPSARPEVAWAPTHHGSWREFAPLPIDGVLAAAIRVFVARGYHGATMRSIATEAGMSVPGVYHHYASKQALLVAVLDLTMGDLGWRLRHAREEAIEPVPRLSLVVEALALFHARRSDLAFIGASEMRSLEPVGYARIAALRGAVQGLLDDQVSEATDPALYDGRKARDAGKAIATMCTGLAQWFRTDGATPPEQIAREYAEFALRLLSLEPPGDSEAGRPRPASAG